MFKLLQKLVILWEKSKFRTLLEMESKYIYFKKTDIISKDLTAIRGKLAKLRAIKEPKSTTQRDIIDLEAEINETEKHRQMIKSSEEKLEDLNEQIKMYKKTLWS